MDVLRIQMGGDEYLAVRPSLRRKLLRHLIRQRSCDLLLRREGLDIVIEPDRAILLVHLPGGKELLRCQLRCAVLSTDQLLPVLLSRLLLLGDIPRHTMERSRGLLLVLDECDRGHQRTSRSASSCNPR